MPDFTSALFLDWRHPSADLPTWDALTSGRPAALAEAPATAALADRVARRAGAEAGVVHRSALHALWDVVDVAAGPGTTLLLDGGAYPISEIAAAGAVARGRRVEVFRHHDVDDLDRRARQAGGRVVVLTDGWCTGCSRPAPLAAAGSGGRLLVVDDSVAAGVLGLEPTAGRPFGSGGSGTPAWLGLSTTGVQVASLAKAYGAPVAVTVGPRWLIGPLRGHGFRWHSSPSSSADLAAAAIATADEAENDRRRRRLEHLVRALRSGLRSLGLPVVGLPFPVVSVALPGLTAAAGVLAALARGGVRALLRQPRCRQHPQITFALTARHAERDVEQALDVLRRYHPRAGVAA